MVSRKHHSTESLKSRVFLAECDFETPTKRVVHEIFTTNILIVTNTMDHEKIIHTTEHEQTLIEKYVSCQTARIE